MPVSFKTSSTTLNGIMGALGLLPIHIEKLINFDITLDFSPSEVALISTKHKTKLPILSSSANIEHLKSGKLGPVTAKILKDKITKAVQALPGDPEDWDGKFVAVPKPQSEYEEEAEPLLSSVVEKFALDKHNATPIPLRKATMMYQPVIGTSANSRYFTVGLSKEFKIAARWKNSTLSIRVEGSGLTTMTHLLSNFGFSTIKKGDYASMHLEVGQDAVLANRTLGAVVSSFAGCTNFYSAVPNVNEVKQ